MRSTVHDISANATGMMATGDSISAADGFGASGKGQAALRWRKATAHCMQQQQQESLSASGKGSYADDSSDDEDDGRLGRLMCMIKHISTCVFPQDVDTWPCVV